MTFGKQQEVIWVSISSSVKWVFNNYELSLNIELCSLQLNHAPSISLQWYLAFLFVKGVGRTMTERVKPKWSSNGHLHKHKSHSTICMKKKESLFSLITPMYCRKTTCVQNYKPGLGMWLNETEWSRQVQGSDAIIRNNRRKVTKLMLQWDICPHLLQRIIECKT